MKKRASNSLVQQTKPARGKYDEELSTGQKMRRNLLYDIKRPEQMASLSDQNDDVELWP